jgi:hypothetical protein
MEHVLDHKHVIVQQDIMDLIVNIPSVPHIVSMEIVLVQIHVLVLLDGMEQFVICVI